MKSYDPEIGALAQQHLKRGRFTLGPGEIGAFVDVHDCLLTEPRSMYLFTRALYDVLPRSVTTITPAPSPISTILTGSVLAYEQMAYPQPRLSGRLYRGGSRNQRKIRVNSGTVPNGRAALITDVAVTSAMVLQQATALRSEGNYVTHVAALFLRSRILADELHAHDLEIVYVLGPDELDELLPAHAPPTTPVGREARDAARAVRSPRRDHPDPVLAAMEHRPRTLADDAYARLGLPRPRVLLPSSSDAGPTTHG